MESPKPSGYCGAFNSILHMGTYNTTINKIAHKNKTIRLFQFNLFEFISNIKNLIEN
jgi:hypothetical protein